MLRRISQATMADQQQPAAAAAAAPDAAAGGSPPSAEDESLLGHLRALSTTSADALRQQAGGPAGVVEALAGVASSSFGNGGGATGGAPPFPVVSAGDAGDAGDAAAGGGGRSRANAAAAAPPRRQEECLLYLQSLAVHGSNLAGCIDSGTKLEAVATCVKAVGTASTCLRERRADIARSGIIPALVQIATAYQRPAAATMVAPAAGNNENGDANMADASSSSATGEATTTAGAACCPVLTPAHPELVECCLLAGHYRAAARLLATIPVRTVSAAKTACMASAIAIQNEGTDAAAASAAAAAGGAAQPSAAPAAASALSNSRRAPANPVIPGVTTETYLRYFYYLGMIRVGCDDLEGAVAAFSVCLTVPSQAVSAITIAARKKMILCRCLLSDPTSPSDLAAVSGHSDGDDGESAKKVKSATRARLLSIPAAASPAVERFLRNASPSFSSSPDQPGHFPGGNLGMSSSSGSIKRSRGAAGDYYDDDVAMAPSAFEEGRRVSVRADSGVEDDAPEVAVEQPSGADAGAEIADGKPKADAGRDGGDGGDGGGGGAPTADSARRLREGNSYNLGLYDSLVDAFASDDIKKFREAREAMASILAVDGNAGLAEKVESDMQCRQVYAVADVYEVVSIATLASGVGLEGRTAEAESLVRKMVATGGISAKIDHESGMISFCDDEDDEDSDEEDEYRAELAGQMQQCIDLADRIRILDADITASSRYQQISVRKEANAKANAQSGEGGEGSSSGTGGGPRGVADIR